MFWHVAGGQSSVHSIPHGNIGTTPSAGLTAPDLSILNAQKKITENTNTNTK